MDNNEFNSGDDLFTVIEDILPPDEETNKKNESAVKNIYSNTHLGLFIFSIVMYGISFICAIAVGLFVPKEIIDDPTLYSYINMGINILAQYLIAFPVFLLVTKGIRKCNPREKTKLSIGEFAAMFLISYGLMYAGNIIGQFVGSVAEMISGIAPDNSLENALDGTPLWLIAIVVVIFAPIVEELMFRKIMIDRLSVVGEKTAIIFSALAFAIFHANIYQFFYAAFIGLVFGYVYVKTRDVRYTIVIHMLINFLGSVVALPVSEQVLKFYEQYEIILTGGEADMAVLVPSLIVTVVYMLFNSGLSLAGLIILVVYLVDKKIRLESTPEIKLMPSRTLPVCAGNVGFILFVATEAIMMIMTFFG